VYTSKPTTRPNTYKFKKKIPNKKKILFSSNTGRFIYQNVQNQIFRMNDGFLQIFGLLVHTLRLGVGCQAVADNYASTRVG